MFLVLLPSFVPKFWIQKTTPACHHVPHPKRLPIEGSKSQSSPHRTAQLGGWATHHKPCWICYHSKWQFDPESRLYQEESCLPTPRINGVYVLIQWDMIGYYYLAVNRFIISFLGLQMLTIHSWKHQSSSHYIPLYPIYMPFASICMVGAFRV